MFEPKVGQSARMRDGSVGACIHVTDKAAGAPFYQMRVGQEVGYFRAEELTELTDGSSGKFSLNGASVSEVKNQIASLLKTTPESVRLFGSRITGGYREDSDLDVAIRDPELCDLWQENDDHHFYFSVFGLKVQAMYVPDFSNSWLHGSV